MGSKVNEMEKKKSKEGSRTIESICKHRRGKMAGKTLIHVFRFRLEIQIRNLRR